MTCSRCVCMFYPSDPFSSAVSLLRSFSCLLLSHVNSYWFLWTLSGGAESVFAPHGSPPPSSLSLVVYTYLVSAPRPWQQLVLRFGWELITPLRRPAKKRVGILKRVKWGCLFWVTLFRRGKSDSMRRVICSMCATTRLLRSLAGDHLRSTLMNCFPNLL